MSGVTGAERIRSRADFDAFAASYENIINKFPGFVDLRKSGSYNSDPDKQSFGDIDLIAHIQSTDDKAVTKKKLQAFFHAHPETTIVPFSSVKHAGKRSYNSGEIVTVRYHDDQLGYSVQVDNIIASSDKEAQFKQEFLDMPAEKQGLILGLVKVAAIETDTKILFKRLGIHTSGQLEDNQEYEFNLSSSELQLRKNTYKPGTYEQESREVLWTSKNFDEVRKLLYQYDLNQNFNSLLNQVKQTIKNPRSPQRIKGVFNSMITVKSGEVGTPKGAGKEAARAKVDSTFGESRSLFRSLVESDAPRKIVFAFVRFQPPTVGHELLITTVKETAEANHCPYAIYVSKTQDHKKNPLSIEQKMMYLNKLFPGTNFIAAGPTTRTPIEAAKELNGKFNDLILVAGSDRATLRDTLEAYNHKEYDYNSIDFVSAGERDPDADDITGVSGTNIRQMAVDGDYDMFKSNLPNSADDATAEQLMKDIQAGMAKPVRAKKSVKGKEDMNEGNNLNEKWSDKYKRSINCSHPKGFSQKAHCAGKRKHTESIEMEQVCPDCGMCQTHGNLEEIKKGQKDSNGYTKCWKGYRAQGTKKSKTTGKRVRNCVPISEDFEIEMSLAILKLIESQT